MITVSRKVWKDSYLFSGEISVWNCRGILAFCFPKMESRLRTTIDLTHKKSTSWLLSRVQTSYLWRFQRQPRFSPRHFFCRRIPQFTKQMFPTKREMHEYFAYFSHFSQKITETYPQILHPTNKTKILDNLQKRLIVLYYYINCQTAADISWINQRKFTLQWNLLYIWWQIFYKNKKYSTKVYKLLQKYRNVNFTLAKSLNSTFDICL